ncbi:AraC family transcriptional regulator [Anaeromicropila herbilytica]|uniref:AraC family transcriptional regulator n=1 Tax=Anaeromicropila herbilytica TaxID=2785025 RepID=A0A7R7IDU7_9FIRM|nr:AraC family transcriptional regulator [Anaeromicropila herbilytica]BCN31927.1 AraC family transcriptional regulator [Anaeromicropila herbilytica]
MNYYYDNIFKAIQYIENNLMNDLNLTDIISCTGFSKYHFARIFKAISGYTINDYIRKRRMTEATRLLTNSNMRILDIAISYGYNSQEAFTRAFKEVYDVTPRYYREHKLCYDNLGQLILSEELLDAKTNSDYIEPIIVEKDSFYLVGIEYQGQNRHGEIPKLWNELDRYIDDIGSMINKDSCYGLERYMDYTEEEHAKDDWSFRYLAGVELLQCDEKSLRSIINCQQTSLEQDGKVDNKTEFLMKRKIIKIQKSKYAVFPIQSVIENVPNTIGKIYSMYLPKTGLKIKGDYDFEFYDNSFRPNEYDSYLYLYIPIED